MKKSIGLLMIVMAVISMAFVSCDANTAPQTDTLGEIYLSNESQSREITVTGDNAHEVENLFWYYKAEKIDNGLFNTGATDGFVPVKKTQAGEHDKGLSGAKLGLFSYGNWTFTFYGVKEKLSGTIPASTIDSDLIVYSGSQTIEVNKDKNFLNLTLNEGDGLTTEIKFDTTEGVWFRHENITTPTDFTLEVVDKVNGVPQGVITAGAASFIDRTDGKAPGVAFKNISYTTKPEKGIAEGQHVMTFTLTQNNTGSTTTNIATVATYEITFIVSKGLTYTVKGDLTSAEVQGEVSVGSYAVSVPVTTASKVIPVKSADFKVVKEETTVSTLDLTVKYPLETVLTDTTNTAVSGSSVTADATIGFKLNPNVDGGISTVGPNQELTKYELILNVAQTNKTLVEVSKFIGKNLEIEKVYHKGVEVPRTGSVGLEETTEEHYDYSPTEGILKLYVKNASPIDVVTKKVLAVASIGDEKFTTLEAAIEAAGDGDTIKLTCDIEKTVSSVEGSCYTITDKSITIDGQKHVLKLTGELEHTDTLGTDAYGIRISGNDNKKTVTLKDMKIDTYNIKRAVRTDGAIGVKIEDCTILTSACGIHVKGSNNVEINKTNITVNVINDDTFLAHIRTAVMVGGANANVSVNNSNIIATNESKAEMGVTNWYWSWCKGLYVGNTGKKSTLTVSNTTVDADYSICIDGTEDSSNPSSITIENGTYKGLIASPSGNSYKSLTINGGTFSGITDLNSFNGKDNDIAKLVISGGTFNVEPDSKYIVDGYYAEKNGDGNYEVKKATNWIQLADTSWYDSSKTEFNVSSAEQLAGLAKLVNTGNNFSGKTIKLASDIVLSGLNWTPIGGAGSGKRFSGTFDGLTHTISGMEAVNNVNYGNGFFGDTIGATIKNITFTNAFVSANSNPLVYYGNVYGIVAGYSYGETLFENVHVSDSVISGYGKVGAILGMAADPGNHNTKFNNCTVDNVDMYGVYDVGGLAGLVQNKLIISGNNTSVTNLNWIKSSSEIYVTLNEALVVASEQYPSGSTCYLSGKPITGDYWKYGNYLYGGFAKYAVMYGTSAHDCTLTGDYSGYYLANMERVINDLNQLSSLNNPWKK